MARIVAAFYLHTADCLSRKRGDCGCDGVQFIADAEFEAAPDVREGIRRARAAAMREARRLEASDRAAG